MEYVPYLEIAGHLDIHEGDKVYIGSDIRPVMQACRRNKEKFDLELFIRSFTGKVGPEGTIIIPTFNWDFCKGMTFDYFHTPGQVGSMGTYALKMKEFKRTKHPIYSFAVFGKDQDLLYNMDNRQSFGEGTPFEYLHEYRVKCLSIGIDWSHMYTYVHHVEQIVGDIPYRYFKDFTAPYIDADGKISDRTYSMYVRRLELDTRTLDDKMKELVESNCSVNENIINGTSFQTLSFYFSSECLKNDIIFNKSKNTTYYIGQN